MLTITPLKSQAGGGVPAYLKSTEYYRDAKGDDLSSSTWLGRGAEALGLAGQPVDVEIMDRLADGFSPDGKTALRQNAGAKPEWRPTLDRQGKPRLDKDGKEVGAWVGDRLGYDMTFSAPKSFSITFALADPSLRDEMLAAHHAAVDAGVQMMQKHAAETRRGKGGKDHIEVDGLVISRHTHFAARSHDRGPGGAGDGIDPQVHSHCLCYNICQGKDGQWGTLEPREMFAWKKAVGACYRAELAQRMRKLGFVIEADHRLDHNGEIKERFWKVAGIPQDLADERSGRRKQILDYMREHGGSAQEANLATRADKDEPSFPELIERWGKEFAAYRELHPDTLPEDMRELQGLQQKQQEQSDDREILADLHRTKSVWSRKDLVQSLAERSTGELGLQGVVNETSQFLSRNDLALVKPEQIHASDKGTGKRLARRHRHVRFADQEVVRQEEAILKGARARKDEQHVRLDGTKVDQAVRSMETERGFTLSTEQRKAVNWVCRDTGGVAIIEGRAGTGKTTAADAIVRAYQDSGRKVIGAATGWDAAKKLEAESGIESHSIASLTSQIDQGKLRLDKRSVLLVDEAGMVGTPSLQKLMGQANNAGAKVLLQGDRLQLQSVERGGPMRLLARELGSAQLKRIRRQKHSADRKTADMFYEAGDDQIRSRSQNAKAGAAILDRMEQRGQLQGYASRDEAMGYLVDDYMTSKTEAREKLIIAGTRQDVSELNRRVRDARRQAGELGPEHQIQSKNPRTGVLESINLAKGDAIRFGKKDDGLGVVNGTRAVVTQITQGLDGQRIKAAIESDIPEQDGREIEFSTNDYGAIDHAYASTVHRAQGQGRKEVYHLGHRGMTDRQLSLVAFTRSKESYAIYGAADELFDRGLDAKVTEDRLQTNALSEGLVGKTTQQILRERAQEKMAQKIQAPRQVTAQPGDQEKEKERITLAQRAGAAMRAVMERAKELKRGMSMGR